MGGQWAFIFSFSGCLLARSPAEVCALFFRVLSLGSHANEVDNEFVSFSSADEDVQQTIVLLVKRYTHNVDLNIKFTQSQAFNTEAFICAYRNFHCKKYTCGWNEEGHRYSFGQTGDSRVESENT